MKIRIQRAVQPVEKDNCLIFCPVVGGKLTPLAADFEAAGVAEYTQLLERGILSGPLGSSFWMGPESNAPEQILLSIPAATSALDALEFRNLVRAAVKQAQQVGITKVKSYLGATAPLFQEVYWKIRHEVEALREALYAFSEFKEKPSESVSPIVEWSIVVDADVEDQMAEAALRDAEAISKGVNTTKRLGNLPANYCSPTFLGEQALRLGAAYPERVSVRLLGEADLREQGMYAYLAVAQGSHQGPCLAVIEYRGSSETNQPPYVFVGKGLTFDSGGISLKPSENMAEMKYDMSGAGTVCGLIEAVAELQLPLNVVGLMAACENMPGGGATRPGDIVRTAAGLTVEIINTDAEGRLVLADALTYAKRFNPKVVIDIATLTGACIVALSHHLSGLLSNDRELAQALLAAGELAADGAWQLPLGRLYAEQLKSTFADLSNTGTKGGGTITAAAFLEKFASTYRWAHLDVAGTASRRGKDNGGATGRPVPLLVQYLLEESKRMAVSDQG